MPTIHTIDLHFQNVPQIIASYLVQGDSGLALIETGPSTCLPAMQAGLDALGYQAADIQHVLLSHIHFDHAGAAGWWAKQGAQIYVHHFGAKHLIDPSRLLASATRIYGEAMDSLWGELIPIPAEQVTALHDNDVIQVGDLRFTALDTPGHARHHMTYALDDVAFTGDVAAIHLPGHAWVDVPAPPPEFDLDAWHESLARLGSHKFARIYPTHYGPIDEPSSHFAQVKETVSAVANFVAERLKAGDERDAILAQYEAWLEGRMQKAGIDTADIITYKTVNPMDMSVDGLIRYWRKRWEAE